jgi:uncharacterized protein
MAPTNANGKICYLEIPANDVKTSSKFYETVFGWSIRTRGDGHLAFDDTTGQVSGSWIEGRTPGENVGILTYIMVNSAEDTCAAIVANGGSIIQPIGADAPEVTARFKDPAGNVMGLYQQRSGS